MNSDACVAPVLNFAEAPQHSHNKDRMVFNGARYEASPAPRFDRTQAAKPTGAVAAGSSIDNILAELGIESAERERLRAAVALP